MCAIVILVSIIIFLFCESFSCCRTLSAAYRGRHRPGQEKTAQLGVHLCPLRKARPADLSVGILSVLSLFVFATHVLKKLQVRELL